MDIRVMIAGVWNSVTGTIIGTKKALDVNVAKTVNSQLQSTPKGTSVELNSTGPTALPATPLAGRTYVTIQNNNTSSVNLCDSKGTVFKQLNANDSVTYKVKDETVQVYGIVTSGTPSVLVEEGVEG